ncbi:MAG: endonuclease III domain-containing protein [Chloroflexia bacterium]
MHVHSHEVVYAPADAEDSVAGPAAKIAPIQNALLEVYGRPDWRPHHPPLDELVLTVLSQHTSDLNSGRAFALLRAELPTWEEVRDAPVERIAAAIQSGGLARQKAPRIKTILQRIWDERGSFDLDFLKTAPIEEAEAWLAALPGVGPKTAACVLLFACGRPAMPVDTHVHRVSRRLGLVPDRYNAEQTHEALEALVPPDWYYSFHLNVIKHGREVCKAPRPRCEICVLTTWCDYYRGRKPT